MNLIPLTSPVKWSVLSVLSASSGLIAMEFTPSEINTFMLAATGLVGAVLAGVVSIIVALRETRKKVERVATDTAVVLGHVNSEKTQYEERIKAKDRELELKDIALADLRREAGLLAQARAIETVQAAGVKVDAVKLT